MSTPPDKEFFEYARKLSHDLQAPVNKIVAFVDLLNEKLKGTPDEISRDYLRRLENNASILRKLLSEFKEFARKD